MFSSTIKKNTLKFLILIPLTLLLFSCANKPIVDTKGIDLSKYTIDLQECKALAAQLSTAKSVGKSAAFGAIVTGALTAVLGGDVKKSASVGAIQGGAAGALTNDGEKSSVVKRCLTNRGYVVLN